MFPVSVDTDLSGGKAGEIRGNVNIDSKLLQEFYKEAGLGLPPDSALEDIFEDLACTLEEHLTTAYYSAIDEFFAHNAETHPETLVQSLIDVGCADKSVKFCVAGEEHTATLGPCGEDGRSPLYFDGATHWRQEAVPCPWTTARPLFFHEAEKAISGFYADVRRGQDAGAEGTASKQGEE